MLDVGLVLSLALLLWLLMLRPIRSLERFAAAVHAGENPAAPRPALFFGELGALRDSIRRMLDMLDSRYRAMRDSEERLSLATRSASIGVWDWDVVRDEIVWDDEVHRMYGLSRGQFGGSYAAWLAMLDPADVERANQAIEGALRGDRSFACEFSILRPDRTRRVVKGEATTTRDAGGRVLRMVGVVFDITEQRAAEEEVRQLNADLERRVDDRTAQLQLAIDEVLRARDQAESATRAKSEFLANMSHEIRTPMNAVLGMTELALRGDLPARERDYLVKARSAAESLLSVLNDILDFSKIEAGKLELERVPFRLRDVLQAVATVVGLRAQEKGLRLAFEVAPAVPARLVGDRLRLEQVLINLFTNAVKFTERGEVVLTVAPADGAPAGPGTLLRFAVRDTGIGMTTEQVAGLFQPFNQLDASTSRKYGGTGLGLAICRRLVGMMGGEIGAANTPGQGSEFRFTAVFEAADAAGADEPVATGPGDEAALLLALRSRRVLLVEDNELNQIVAAELLRTVCGMQVSVAESGAEALSRLGTEAFDLVLMDVQMPGMDGYEVTRRIRRDPAFATLPIVAMTAHAMAADRERCLAAGMNDFLSKPFEPQELFRILNRWLRIGPVGAEARRVDGMGAAAVSVELGLRRCMGIAELYATVVRRYLDSRSRPAEDIRAAIDAGDLAAAARVAHSLISTAGALGAMRLSETARALQVAIDADDAERRHALMQTLEAEQVAVRRELEAYLAGLQLAAS